MSFGTFTKKRKQENKLIRSENKNKPITNKLKGAIPGNGAKILMISKLNILIHPCTKNNKLLSIVEARVETSEIGFYFINYQFIT